MNKWIKILSGLVVLVVPLYLIMSGMPLSDWGSATLEFIKGGITLTILLTGITLIIIGISELKN